MIVLADRNFAAQALITAIAGTGADLLIRTKSGRRLPVCRRLPDGTYLSRIGPVQVRVIRAEITIASSAGQRREVYQLVTTALRRTACCGRWRRSPVGCPRQLGAVLVGQVEGQVVAAGCQPSVASRSQLQASGGLARTAGGVPARTRS